METEDKELPPLWDSKEHLLQDLKQCRKAAYEHFYRVHHIQLYCFAYYLVRKEQEAKDIMLDAFHSLKLHRSFLKSIEDVEPFLLKAVHYASDIFLQRYQLGCRSMDSEIMQRHIATATAMQQTILLIERIPEPLKSIYTLAYGKEPLGDGEIAEHLQLPVIFVRKKRRILQNTIHLYTTAIFNNRLQKKPAR